MSRQIAIKAGRKKEGTEGKRKADSRLRHAPAFTSWHFSFPGCRFLCTGWAVLLLVSFSSLLSAQEGKKALTQDDISGWKTIDDARLSNNGRWISYALEPNEGDATLILYDTQKKQEKAFPRGHSARLSAGNDFFAFLIKPHEDTLRAQRRHKVKDKDLPKDTLAIYRLANGQLTKVPQVKSMVLPDKWSGWLAYQLEPMKPDTTLPDSVKVKKENKKNGSSLIIRNLKTEMQDTVPYVKSYLAAEEGPRFLIHSTGRDSTFAAGVYLYDCTAAKLAPLLAGEGSYTGFTFDKAGEQAAFLAYRDTLGPRVTPYALYYWAEKDPESHMLVDTSSELLPKGWLLGEHADIEFSEDGSKLYFGIAPPPVLQDTTLLEEEIVKVEVWAYTDARLYTHEEDRLEKEKKRAFRCVYHLEKEKAVRLATEEVPEIRTGNEGNAGVALAYNDQPYLQQISWEGYPYCRDLYLVDLASGARRLIAEKVCGSPNLSPEAKYAYWYSAPDSAWYAYSVEEAKIRELAPDIEIPFYNELYDQPSDPNPYGIAGWTTEDDFIMIYDRYDIWLVDPKGLLAPNNLTGGREGRKQYRYIRLDPEERSIEEVKPMLLYTFDEKSKASGYAWFDIHTGIKKQVQEGAFSYSRGVRKAKDANAFLFRRENFQVFPDLLYSQGALEEFLKISNANPQQKKFRWGTAEPYSWTGAQGNKLKGILIKPEGFDAGKQYPMMTYFYERYADRLHNHWTPSFPRSIINFTYYASRGYLIFIPDIVYQKGYPGKSAYDAVTTGVSSLMEKGFVDPGRIGVQGHSWGGYQVAYLITQTNLFRCAESGAPVVNMTSAYGGIRWGSGLSRMFQYERSQSRIGGTLWERPMQYIENSPLFYTDKVETPVLILHNDDDGAVPWYQGIEWFVALRRLGKPAWMLNYNNNPHWVMDTHNRKDFQRRMQQFFDHYLLDGPLPEWMKEGVPPIEKGIRQGFEAADGGE